MIIDGQVEPLVRATLDAAVKRDLARFRAALAGFPDDETARHGLELVVAIIGVVLADLYDGMPSTDDVNTLAADVSRQEAWVGPTASTVATFVSTVLGGRPLGDVLPSTSVVLAYVLAANLLTSSSNPDEGEWWFNYLDKVEATIESI